jgi:rhodanese-related sulfurtransferase
MAWTNVDPMDAKKLLDGADGWFYLDVRTEGEFMAGHAVGAWNVPMFVRGATGRASPNPDFLAVVKKNFPADARFVVGCATGVRSQHACEALAAAGYANLRNLSSGFQGRFDETGDAVAPGWLGCGLPSESAGPKERTYETLRAKA